MLVRERDIEQCFRGDGHAFTRFVNDLLRAHLANHAVPDAALTITDAAHRRDGGIDAAIDQGVDDGPEGWCREPTIWQFKARTDKPSPSGIQEELGSDFVRTRLQRGFAYRLALSRPLTAQEVENLDATLVDAVSSIHPGAAAPRCLGAGALAVWASRYPAVALVLRHPRMMELTVTLPAWVEKCRQYSPQYVPVAGCDALMHRIRQHVDISREVADPVLCVAGEPGVGRRRLVAEALGSGATGALTLVPTTPQAAHEVAAWFSNDDVTHAVLIVPQATSETVTALRDVLSAARHRVRAVAVVGTEEAGIGAIAVPLPTPQEVSAVVKANFSARLSVHRRLLHESLAGPYPGLAIELCLHDDQVRDGEAFVDPDPSRAERLAARVSAAGLRVAAAVALFDQIGTDDDVAAELGVLAQATSLTEGEVRQAIESLVRCGLLRRYGRFVAVHPPLIARALFARGLAWYAGGSVASFVSKLPSALAQAFLRQLSEEGDPGTRRLYSREAVKAVRSILPPHLTDRDAVLRLELLGKIAPEEVLPEIADQLEACSPEEVRGINGRQRLVWLAEYLAGFADHFYDAERVLIRLAEHETSPSLGNNATRTWQSLFRIWLPGTEVEFGVRAKLLEERLNSTSHPVALVALGAIERMLEMSGPTRTMGPPIVSGRVHPADRHPTTGDERGQAYGRVAELLVAAARASDPRIAERATTMLAAKTYVLLQWGQAHVLREYFSNRGLDDSTRVPVVEGIVTFFRSETGRTDGHKTRHLSDYFEVVRLWQSEVEPISFHDRLVQTLSAHHQPIIEPEAWREAMCSLGADLDEPGRLASELPWLASAGATNALGMGRVLGRGDSGARHLNAIIAEVARTGVADLAQGYVGALMAVHPDHRPSVARALDELEATRPILAWNLAKACSLEEFDGVGRAMRLVAEDLMAPRELHSLAFRSDLTADALACILRGLLSRGDEDSLSACVEVACMNTPKQQTRALILATDENRALLIEVLERTCHFRLAEDWRWAYCLLALSEVNAQAASELAALASVEFGFIAGGPVVQAVIQIAQAHPPEFMEAWGRLAESPDTGAHFRIEVFREVVEALPPEVVLRWLERTGLEGARILARHLPLPDVSSVAVPPVLPKLTETVLGRYGHDEAVREAFVHGSMSQDGFVKVDPDVPEREAAAVAQLRRHPERAVRQWATDYAKGLRHQADEWRQERDEHGLI